MDRSLRGQNRFATGRERWCTEQCIVRWKWNDGALRFDGEVMFARWIHAGCQFAHSLLSDEIGFLLSTSQTGLSIDWFHLEIVFLFAEAAGYSWFFLLPMFPLSFVQCRNTRVFSLLQWRQQMLILEFLQATDCVEFNIVSMGTQTTALLSVCLCVFCFILSSTLSVCTQAISFLAIANLSAVFPCWWLMLMTARTDDHQRTRAQFRIVYVHSITANLLQKHRQL